tara:strand:+ start:577 stop:1170 length:594 start_codon:yes stop_codon:yes gene_type:complete
MTSHNVGVEDFNTTNPARNAKVSLSLGGKTISLTWWSFMSECYNIFTGDNPSDLGNNLKFTVQCMRSWYTEGKVPSREEIVEEQKQGVPRISTHEKRSLIQSHFRDIADAFLQKYGVSMEESYMGNPPTKGRVEVMLGETTLSISWRNFVEQCLLLMTGMSSREVQKHTRVSLELMKHWYAEGSMPSKEQAERLLDQ